MQDKKTNPLVQFLQERPSLNISQLAKEAGFSMSLLDQIKKEKTPLTAGKAFALAIALSRYGLVLNRWIFEPYDIENYPLVLSCYRFKDIEQETIEIEHPEGGTSFEYKVTIYRDVMEQSDFAEFLGIY